MEAIDPARLRPHYSAFLRDDRILLTGHSHQAWPDVARAGMLRAWQDAAEDVDDKWEHAFEAAEAVREAAASRIGARPDEIALGASTHELVARFLSAVELRTRPRIVTTTGEFHSLYRQLARLREEGVEVVWVDAHPVATLANRLAGQVNDRTAAVLASTVLFETAEVVPGLHEVTVAARARGAQVLFDAYHAFGVVPFRASDLGEDAFITAGGYKYAQWGEGCCFLRVPSGCALRPVYTGWFSDFASLAGARSGAPVAYGDRPADRFAGSTYDPTSHYRARAVIEFFAEQALTLDRLRAVSLEQTARIREALEGYEVVTPGGPSHRGGFVTVRVDDASDIVLGLREVGVFVDARGNSLRFGPAPYTTNDEIDRALEAFRELAPDAG